MSQKFDKIRREEEALLCRGYARYPVAIVKGEGSRLWDVDGKEYIDLLSGLGVVGLGHCNPEVIEALQNQARLLWHVSNLFYQEPQLELARLLLSASHHGKVFFCNSGAEANEAAIKLARRYTAKIKKRNAAEVISISGAFHGRTLATLAATGRKSLQDGFEPLPAGFIQVPARDLAALEKAMGPQTCSVILECIQGEAGVEMMGADYLKGVQALCRENDVLFICDEVQCGLCRSGKFWAYQNADLEPDIISSAKALANGLPMGAMLASEEVSKGFETGSHATTFGGGALTSAVAAKVISIMLRDNLAGRAAQLGAELKLWLQNLMRKYPESITEVRGIGLMIGIELGDKAPEIWRNLLNAGFIVNLNHNRALRLLPPLTIARQDLQAFVEALESELKK